MRERVGICLSCQHISASHSRPIGHRFGTHFSSSARSRVSKLSSQPTSTNIFIPPSNSKIDCDAFEDDDCAPNNGVKVNIVTDRQVWSQKLLRQACSRRREQQVIPGFNFRLYKKSDHYPAFHSRRAMHLLRTTRERESTDRDQLGRDCWSSKLPLLV